MLLANIYADTISAHASIMSEILDTVSATLRNSKLVELPPGSHALSGTKLAYSLEREKAGLGVAENAHCSR